MPMTPLPQEIWQHYKTKGEYEIISLGKIQVKDLTLDMKEVVIYKALSDEKIWVRPLADFIEEIVDEKKDRVKRFEKIS